MAWGGWPAYRDRKPRERTLALLVAPAPGCQDGWVVLESGEQVNFSGWKGLKQILSTHNLELLTHSIGQFPWMAEAIDDEKARVVPNHEGRILGISVTGAGRRQHWIGSTFGWPGIERLDLDALRTMRALYDYCGVGVRQSPAALGQAMARSSLPPDQGRRTNMPEWAREYLRQGGIGGRSDTLVSPDEHFEEAFEIDMNNAYLWACQLLPGKWMMLQDWDSVDIMGPAGPGASLQTWNLPCTVEIPEGLNLAIGPFCIRNSEGLIVSPTEPGTYETHLWKEEAQDCIEHGLTVTPHGSGLGWYTMTSMLRQWVAIMVRLREEAPARLQPMIKMAIVAGIGWHGQRAELLEAVPLEGNKEGDPVVVVSDSLMFGVKVTKRRTLPYQSDWYWFIQMACRRMLLSRVDQEIAAGNRVLSTNFDAILLQYRSKIQLRVTEKKGPAQVNVRVVSGHGVQLPYELEVHPNREIQWKERVLHDVTVPYPRAITSREKVCRPGIPVGTPLPNLGRTG